MENKINIAELLKDCPLGMKLDCTINDNVKFIKICSSSKYPIILRTKNGYEITLTKYGQVHDMDDSKCVIFPKGKTTWEGFQRPIKDGDIVFYNDTIAIFKEWGDETLFRTYVTRYLCCDSLIDTNVPLFGKSVRKEIRFATEEEKAKLFQAIKEKGYHWNTETKTLEKLVKPIFKVGDRIKSKGSDKHSIIKNIEFDRYVLNNNQFLKFTDEHHFELVPNKFDINTLKPFDKVLVRQDENSFWMPSIFGFYNEVATKNPFICSNGFAYKYCIPYEVNKELIGTTNNPKEYGR